MRVLPKLNRSEGGKRRPRRLRAIAVLPTMATLGNLLCGFAAIHFCMRALFAAGGGLYPLEIGPRESVLLERILPSYLAMAGYLIFLAMLFDTLDGRLARLARRTTEFGGQLDSISDMVSFGLAPAMLMLALLSRQLEGEWLVTPLGDTFGRAAWITAAMFVGCAALRLARYNVENEPGEQRRNYFKGLPTPAAASVLASLVILHEWVFVLESQNQQLHGSRVSQELVKALPVVALLLGLLMVSRIRYVHFGNVFLGGRKPIVHVVLLMVMLLLVVLRPEIALTTYLLLYAVSGPVLSAVRRFRRREAQPAAGEAADAAQTPQQRISKDGPA
ncbi:MAG: phosphatidylcholine/phosphatidylserine synthase [Phycisphaerales bacterium]|nr:MAG: phosphatidylcholine/phosphatidylserine synthase [Phycisphaerales bacterium]